MRTQHRISATCSILLACILLFSACGAAVADAKFAPGTYTSCSKGFGGDVTVTVEVSGARIEAVSAVGDQETAGIGTTALERLPGMIVENQTLKLDAVAGCTITSAAVLDAAANALREAGADDSAIYAEPAQADEAQVETETLETDVLIVGAGASGLSAALSARQNGVENVIVIEKMPAVGGATSTAGGGMEAYRVDEDPAVTEKNIEELFLYWCRTGKFTNNARLTMLAARLSTPTVEWMRASGIGVTGEPAEGEPTFSANCDGRAAGAINTLYEKVREAGVSVMLDTRAEHLIMEDGRVIGVEATGAKGQTLILRAKAVLLATGGYGNNVSLITDTDMLKNVIYYGPVCATGDGHLMAQEIGVPLFNMDKVATKHFGVETTPGQGIHIHWAVAALFTKTGAIAVNKAGERVVDESGDELDIALASMHKSSDGRLYIVMDQEDYTLFSDILMQYGAFTQEQLDAFIQENGSGVTKLVKNDTLAGAAEAIGLDAAAVEATVAAYNQDATAGKADPFGRPYVEEIGEGPYYIMQTVARFATTLGGVNVTDNLEVLDVNEQPVPGLYAAGEIVGNVNGSYAHYLIWCFGSGYRFGEVIPSLLP